jgi:hypothetical protein
VPVIEALDPMDVFLKFGGPECVLEVFPEQQAVVPVGGCRNDLIFEFTVHEGSISIKIDSRDRRLTVDRNKAVLSAGRVGKDQEEENYRKSQHSIEQDGVLSISANRDFVAEYIKLDLTPNVSTSPYRGI